MTIHPPVRHSGEPKKTRLADINFVCVCVCACVWVVLIRLIMYCLLFVLPCLWWKNKDKSKASPQAEQHMPAGYTVPSPWVEWIAMSTVTIRSIWHKFWGRFFFTFLKVSTSNLLISWRHLYRRNFETFSALQSTSSFVINGGNRVQINP